MQVFEDISFEALEVCHASLISASQSVEKALSRLDALLFLLKHLSFLRNQIQEAFQSTDFIQKVPFLELEGVLSEAVSMVVERRFGVGILSDLGKGFVAATSSPQVKHQQLDARQVTMSLYDSMMFSH